MGAGVLGGDSDYEVYGGGVRRGGPAVTISRGEVVSEGLDVHASPRRGRLVLRLAGGHGGVSRIGDGARGSGGGVARVGGLGGEGRSEGGGDAAVVLLDLRTGRGVEGGRLGGYSD